MAGFQFIREECYAKQRGQGAPTGVVGKARDTGSGKLAARDVIAEAIRAPDAAPHVRSPAPARCLYGIEPDELATWWSQIEAMSDDIRVTTKAGVVKKQRSDVPILMGVVASYPGKADDDDELYDAWRRETLAFFMSRYGSSLASVLEHTDEPHGHLHAFVSDKGKPVKRFHAGYSAAMESANAGQPKKTQSIAYQEGARALQNSFYDLVASRVGQARIGPKKRRLTRRAWHAEQAANEAMARAQSRAEKVIADAEAKRVSVQSEASAVFRERQELKASAQQLAENKKRVQDANALARSMKEKSERALVASASVNEKLREKRILLVNAKRKIKENSQKIVTLEGDLNVAQNEISSLKKRLKKENS